jgi:SAM-dependent methyltransferase
MTLPRTQHRVELERNRASWEGKPLLRGIYRGFYRRIARLIDPARPGAIIEIGSGIGNLKQFFPRAVATDLFAHPSLDVVCDGYELPFADAAASHLILFDVLHHLQAPKAFLNEARRVVAPGGRLICFEPYISLASSFVYGLFHPEPIAWRKRIDLSPAPPQPRTYYAAQGNPTRLFFRRQAPAILDGWALLHAEALSCFAYLLSGGYSRPALYPTRWLPGLERLDRRLSAWPKLFAARCLVTLTPEI